MVAIGEFCFAADSPNIVESKSFKLYLNSLNQTVFADKHSLEATLMADLSAASGKPVGVRVRSLDDVQADGVGILPGVCIDELDITVSDYEQRAARVVEWTGFVRQHAAESCNRRMQAIEIAIGCRPQVIRGIARCQGQA